MIRDPEIDQLIGHVPQPQAEIVQARETAMVGGAYDGASRFDRAMALWSPALRSADADLIPEKAIADARTRDTLRNDAYVAGGSTLHKDNIVGAAFVLNSKPATGALPRQFDEKWEEEYQEEVEEKFTLYAESMDNWVDASRMNSLTGLVRLAVGVYVAGGEVLASAEWLRGGARPFNTAIQMVDTDRLSNPPGMREPNSFRAGVERDIWGAPVAYHIRKAHPTDYMNADAYQWKRVEARKPWGRTQMIHILEQHRIDQSRGISEMVAGLKESRITKRLRDVTLQNAVVQATYAASIESELPSEAVFQAMGGGTDDIGTAITNYASGFLGSIAEYAGGAKNLQLDGVKIPHLFPGTKLQMRPASAGGVQGSEFEQSLLRYLAATLGVSYEQLSRDYTNTNYSSARAAMAETWKFMQARKKVVADRFASLIFRLWLEEALNKGLITSMPRMARGWIYEGQNLDALSQCDWIGASRGQIDELKETQAAVLRINNGLSTLEYELARLGLDYRKVLRQLNREDKTKKKYGILQLATDTTNQMNAASGTPKDKGSVEQSQFVELEDRIQALEERIAA